MIEKYPYTDLSTMNLDWVILKVKEMIAAWAETRAEWTDTKAEFEELKLWISNYFTNLDVQNEINNKLDAMALDGTLSDIIAPHVAAGLPAVVADQIGAIVAAQISAVVAEQLPAVAAAQLPAIVATETAGQAAAWLEEHVDPDTGYVIDNSLTIAGAAADAKATGDAITDLKSALTNEYLKKTEGIYPDYPTLFDKRNVIYGYYYNFTTGAIEASASRFYQPPVPCKASTQYTKSTCNVTIFDSAMNRLGQILYDDPNSFTTPANAAFLGVSMTTAHIDYVRLSEGSTAENPQPSSKLAISQVKNLTDEINSRIHSAIRIDSTSYATALPDADTAAINTYYLLNFDPGDQNITDNLPFDSWVGRIGILITFGANNTNYRRQLFIAEDIDGITMYSRSGTSTGDFRDWMIVNKDYVDGAIATTIAALNITPSYIVDKSGGGDYTSLTEAMRKNVDIKCDYYVRPGEYDLITEFKAYYGNDYFDNLSFNDAGLAIKNGSRVFLDANAIVTFEYTGDNDEVIRNFSPFKFSNDGGELHGGQIICSNCRYAIHDDCYNSDHDKRITDGVYIYYRSDRNVAIGGGLGRGSHVEVKNCYIDSTTLGYGIWYHNNSTLDDAENKVFIHDNYTTSGIYIQPLGPTPATTLSRALVSNNKTKAVGKITSEMTYDNFELIEWNNVTT